MATTQSYEELASTFYGFQKDQFLAYVWHEVFAEWDATATTEEAVLRANEAQARAEKAWDGFRGN